MLIVTSSGLLAQLLDPEPAAALRAPAPQMPPPPVPGNWQGLWVFPDIWRLLPGQRAATYPGVVVTPHACLAADGTPIALRWYAPSAPPTGAAVVYAPGGGCLAGSLDQHDCLLRRYVAETGVPFLAVDYRLAPSGQGTTPATEVLAAYTWLQSRAAEFRINPTRCALMGDSGGGGVAAGAVMLAGRRQVPVARQLLVCTLLNDRNQTPAPALAPSANWAGDNDHPGWAALPNEQVGQPPVSLVAGPARRPDYVSLPSTYMEVSNQDIFCDESLAYAQRLAQAGVPLELHVWPSALHALDLLSPIATLGQLAWQRRVRMIRSL